MFGCNNDRLFPEKYTVQDHISNTKLEKGDHYYIQTRHKNLLTTAKREVVTRVQQRPLIGSRIPSQK